MKIELIHPTDLAKPLKDCKLGVLYTCNNEVGVLVKANDKLMFNLTRAPGSPCSTLYVKDKKEDRENFFTPLPRGTKIVLTQE